MSKNNLSMDNQEEQQKAESESTDNQEGLSTDVEEQSVKV